MSNPQIVESPATAIQDEIDNLSMYAIVLYNDEVNSFTHVIDCLVELCEHSPEQAEQCAWIVHTKGKYGVKSGSLEKLTPICDALCLRGLSAVIDETA